MVSAGLVAVFLFGLLLAGLLRLTLPGRRAENGRDADSWGSGQRPGHPFDWGREWDL